ncbi:hypothetical protein U0355_02475 [Salimicrobium sp. PL1-032A]|uniref:DUF6933 domain-containing protein n=1 Tax=Salimicrobium sp. PL1-032A TaxID=3095364 RepID=UPI00325FF61E
MFTIGVTEKLAKNLPMERQDVDTSDVPEIYRWQMNQFVLKDTEGIILMNDRTAITLILFGLEKEQYENMDNVIRGSLKQLLQMLRVKEESKDDVLEKSKKITLTKTDNRRTLGRMNEALKMLEASTEDATYEEVDAVEMNRWMNEDMMYLTLEYDTPVNELNRFYDKGHS